MNGSSRFLTKATEHAGVLADRTASWSKPIVRRSTSPLPLARRRCLNPHVIEPECSATRLCEVGARDATGLCPNPHDIAVAAEEYRSPVSDCRQPIGYSSTTKITKFPSGCAQQKRASPDSEGSRNDEVAVTSFGTVFEVGNRMRAVPDSGPEAVWPENAAAGVGRHEEHPRQRTPLR
jgi:hypothetical protein